MIDINTLNSGKTYVGWQIGDGLVSKLIQRLSRTESGLKVRDIATHTFMLFYENDQWVVVESHAKSRGVKKISFDSWLKDYKLDKVFCVEWDIDLNRVQYYVDFNPGYSIAQITKDAVNELTNKTLWNDSPGVVCSELVALCMKNYDVCYHYNLASYHIKPAHIQTYFENLIKGEIYVLSQKSLSV